LFYGSFWLFTAYASLPGPARKGKADEMTNGGAGAGDTHSEQNLAQLRGYQVRLDSAWSLSPSDAGEIVGIIGSALAVPAPDGSPASIVDAANAYNKASSAYQAFYTSAHSAVSKISGSWTGTRAQAVTAAFSTLLTAGQEEPARLGLAGAALLAWGMALRDAQREDSQGRSDLELVRKTLGPFTGTAGDILGVFETVLTGGLDLALFEGAMVEARRGIASMVTGANIAQAIGEDVATTLTQLASQGGSWLAAMSKATQAAEQAQDTTGFSVDAADVQQAITLLQSAADKLAAGLPRTELPSPSAFGSDVAGPWSAFNSHDLSIRNSVDTAYAELENITQNDITSYVKADHTVAEKAATIGMTSGGPKPQ
jgi:hypothetical protein